MKISISTKTLENRFGTDEAFRMMKAAGFDYADYGLDGWHPDRASVLQSQSYTESLEETVAHYTKVKELADRHGITVYQTHAIFGEFPAFDCEEFLEATIKNIVATNVLGCRYSVIHPVRTLGRFFDEEYDYCHEYNLAFFKKLVPYLEKYDVSIGIEPMWLPDENNVIHSSACSRPEEILQFLEELGDKHFCACPDFGHVALTGKETGDTVGGYVRKLGSSVKMIHAHEVDGIKDSHTVPYTYRGIMDWEDITAALREVNYRGTVNFEVGGNYYDCFTDEMIPEALRHLAAIGKDMLDKINA